MLPISGHCPLSKPEIINRSTSWQALSISERSPLTYSAHLSPFVPASRKRAKEAHTCWNKGATTNPQCDDSPPLFPPTSPTIPLLLSSMAELTNLAFLFPSGICQGVRGGRRKNPGKEQQHLAWSAKLWDHSDSTLSHASEQLSLLHPDPHQG